MTGKINKVIFSLFEPMTLKETFSYSCWDTFHSTSASETSGMLV